MTTTPIQLKTKSSEGSVLSNELTFRELIFGNTDNALVYKTISNDIVKFLPVNDSVVDSRYTWTSEHIYNFVTSHVFSHTSISDWHSQFISDFKSSISTMSTSDISEGDNLYYTDDRARNSISTESSSVIMSYNSASGILTSDVNVDDVTIEIDDVTNKVSVKNNSIGSMHMTSDIDMASKNFNATSIMSRTVNDSGSGIGDIWTAQKIINYVETMNTNLHWGSNVLSVIDSLPSFPHPNDRYIIGENSSDALVDHIGAIAEYIDGEWVYEMCDVNTCVVIEAIGNSVIWNGSSWVDFLNVVSHNSLVNLQGGSGDQMFHLSESQYNELVMNTNNTIHYHSDDRHRSNHTGTQYASTISDFDTATEQCMVNSLVVNSVKSNMFVTYSDGKFELSVPNASTSIKGASKYKDTFSVIDGVVDISDRGINKQMLNVGTGVGQINSDVIPEGVNNKYFTNSSVRSSISGGVTDTSVMSIDRITGELFTNVSVDGSTIVIDHTNKYIKVGMIDGGEF